MTPSADDGWPWSPLVPCRDPQGTPGTLKITVLHDLHLPGAALPTRLVIDDRDTRLVQKWVPRPQGIAAPELYQLLDGEIRAVARLARAFRGHPYPAELPRLVAYDVDGEEPFVLLSDYRGDPALQIGRLTPGTRNQFAISLLWTLKHTAAAGIVHNAVGLPTLRWDGYRVQLTDFERSLLAGEQRHRAVGAAAPSPEQEAGVGSADVRDDVHGAGVALWELVVGRPWDGDAGRLDPGELGPLYADLLSGMLAGRAAKRPQPGQLLDRLAADGTVSFDADLDADLRAGRSRFEEIREQKISAAVPRSRPARRWAVLILALVLAVIVAVLVLVVLR